MVICTCEKNPTSEGTADMSINPRRENQMYQAIQAGIPWQEMTLTPPLNDEEIEFFEAVKKEYDEVVAEFGSCELAPAELNWEDIPDIYHD